MILYSLPSLSNKISQLAGTFCKDLITRLPGQWAGWSSAVVIEFSKHFVILSAFFLLEVMWYVRVRL